MKSLETYAMEWLRYQGSCVLLLNQRPIRYGCGIPDCMGVKRNRHVTEIEVKRTLADFKANALKRHVTYRQRGSTWHAAQQPRQFYFLVPHKLVAQVTPLLPDWAGLLSAPHALTKDEAYLVVKAPVNAAAIRLSVKECIVASALQTNMVLAQRRKLDERSQQNEKALRPCTQPPETPGCAQDKHSKNL